MQLAHTTEGEKARRKIYQIFSLGLRECSDAPSRALRVQSVHVGQWQWRFFIILAKLAASIVVAWCITLRSVLCVSLRLPGPYYLELGSSAPNKT